MSIYADKHLIDDYDEFMSWYNKRSKMRGDDLPAMTTSEFTTVLFDCEDRVYLDVYALPKQSLIRLKVNIRGKEHVTFDAFVMDNKVRLECVKCPVNISSFKDIMSYADFAKLIAYNFAPAQEALELQNGLTLICSYIDNHNLLRFGQSYSEGE